MNYLLLLALGCETEAPTKTVSDSACTETTVYPDADGDGFGDPFGGVLVCEVPSGFVTNFGDCDDLDAEALPDAVWYRDVDGDGFGDLESELVSCTQPVGYIAVAGDCDDFDSTRNPDISWYLDVDGDGFGDSTQPIPSCDDVTGAVSDSTDCDDAGYFIHPEANEVCDLIDNDCDGLIDDEDDDIDAFSQVPIFEDLDGDGYGTSVSLGQACSNTTSGALVMGDCDDTDPLVHPHRLDYADSIDADCDGETGYFVVSSVSTGWLGNLSSSAFGAVMASKDIDGDDQYEVLVGAYNGNDYSGVVHFIPGGGVGDLTSYPSGGVSWESLEFDERAGFAVDFIGDWDGDGVEDIAVGAPYFNEDTGQVYILSTEQEAGPLTNFTHLLTHDTLDVFAGYSVLGIDDLNGDGMSELLVGIRKDDRAGNNRGAVAISYGGDTTTPLTEMTTFYATSNGHQMAYAMSNAGDVDGDGIDDYLWGAPYASVFETNSGGAYLVSHANLQDDTFLLEDAPLFHGAQMRENVGFDIDDAGDFNGDGLSDMLLGAPYLDTAEVDAGGAYVVLGSNSGWASTSVADAELTFHGQLSDDRTGRFVGGLGDIDGDDKDDVGIVAHASDLFDNNAGTVYVVLGGNAGTLQPSDADLIVVGEGTSDVLGKGIVRAGDVNADGLDDFWLGASGASSTGSLYLLEGAERQ